MLFKREKHGALVRRDSSHMVQKGRGRIPFCHGRCFRAQFALQGAHASPSLLAHAAGRDHKQIHAPRGFLPSHGLPPTMAAFRRKAAQLQIQLRGKPRILTGFLLSARHASQRQAEDDTMYAFICTKYHTGLQLSMPFPSLPLFRDVHPKIRIENPPPAPSTEGGWVRVLAPHPVRKEMR